jgi:tRNA-specific 2-thiouridylase
VVGPREALDVRAVEAGEVVWYGDERAATELVCTAQVRAHGTPIPARATILERDGARVLSVAFDRAEPGVAPGQAVVCYDAEERILGGGWIAATFRA